MLPYTIANDEGMFLSFYNSRMRTAWTAMLKLLLSTGRDCIAPGDIEPRQRSLLKEHNPGEAWFLNIHEGDTPDNNAFAKHALKLIDMVLKENKAA